MRPTLLAGLALILGTATTLLAQDRDTKVRNDRKAFQDSLDWIYNDLDAGIGRRRMRASP